MNHTKVGNRYDLLCATILLLLLSYLINVSLIFSRFAFLEMIDVIAEKSTFTFTEYLYKNIYSPINFDNFTLTLFSYVACSFFLMSPHLFLL